MNQIDADIYDRYSKEFDFVHRGQSWQQSQKDIWIVVRMQQEQNNKIIDSLFKIINYLLEERKNT